MIMAGKLTNEPPPGDGVHGARQQSGGREQEGVLHAGRLGGEAHCRKLDTVRCAP